jgi:hypothetical protein
MPNVPKNVLRFVRERGVWLALIVLIMYSVSLMQEAVSYTLALGRLKSRLWHDLDVVAAAGTSLRSLFLLLLIGLWLFRRKRALMRVIVIANTLFTAALLIHAGFLLTVLTGLSARAVGELIGDVALMAVSNILIFSIWYWIIDPPGVIEDEPDPRPWAFLFPQRGSALPGYESWSPRYLDYLFVAFTTSFAFSPTDAAPLNRITKMLMLLQSAISVVTLTEIAGGAINILAGQS